MTDKARWLLPSNLDYLREIEWSGIARGPGSGPMGSGGDGYPVPACPVCGGLSKPEGDWILEAVGHKDGCQLEEKMMELVADA